MSGLVLEHLSLYAGDVEVLKTKKVEKHCNKALETETETKNPAVKQFSGFHLSLMRFTLSLRIKFLRFQISHIRANENIQHTQRFLQYTRHLK